MKASLKFREEKRPVLRAKIPLSIFGLPFQSGLLAGETKELTLNLSTFFESGPSIKVAYRPNDTWNPFSLIVKIGTGPFGSPISSSMLMSAEFFAEKRKLADLSSRDIAGILSGIEVAARTTVPVKGKALVNFRWGMRIPSEMKSGVGGIVDPKTGVSLTKIPFLVMDKIGIEHVDGADSKQAISTASKSGLGEAPNSDVVEACYILKRQLEALQSENGLLKRAVEDLRREISGGKFGDLNSGKYREMEWDGFSKIGVMGTTIATTVRLESWARLLL
ncbi:Mucin-19 [Gossypium arboreum]|uniref:Mucin-19 n=1 Tax=Gossypium arboreum TaxID=29729 RepID=A0A0B0PRS1_GOSAR|nr:Mucin-19 [Gossypium arboreum]